MDYKVLGISSGIGVSLHPFLGNVVGNVEDRTIFHSPGERQWHINFKGVPLYRKLKDIYGLSTDVIISSPDCGSGSILRMSRSKEYGDHKKNDSLALFFKAVELTRTKFFLFENLSGLFKSYPLKEFAAMVPNYRLIVHEAPVTHWGNSQVNRVRLIIVGIRQDLPKKLDHYFRLPDYRHKNMTCEYLYGDLDYKYPSLSLGHVREDQNKLCTIHAGRKLPISEITKIWQTDLKGEKRWKVEGRKFSTAPGVYRNGLKDYPATARKADRQFDHNGLMLTPRQLARIQGIPDSFRLYVSSDKLNYWINKARAAVTKTPPYEISVWFKKKLEKTHSIWNQK